ncbi:MAG: MBOAT family protein [Planctomycetota bacterium]
MLFNTREFGVFLVIVVALFWALRDWRRARIVWLLAASYFFYACWNATYLLLIVFSTFLDYWVGRRLHVTEKPKGRKALLGVSLLGNLGVLAVFKYYDFFVTSTASVLSEIGLSFSPPLLDVLLPVGISFYTFQTLSYTIDIYRRQLEPTDSFLEFALFVTFFPQLVAGPIVRAAHFLPQFRQEPRWSDSAMGEAIWRILKGLFKKIVIADFLAVSIVDEVFKSPGDFGGLDILLAVYGYAFQIYGDFSGYSDIAIGSAQLLGFELPENFNAPYLAHNLQDFWRRWHMSLSAWLRDYLYIPLGGSRGGPWKTYRNLMLTMVLGGLWHGANWTFVAWGTIHGGGLAITRMLQRRRQHDDDRPPSRAGLWLGRLVTFHLVCAAWIFFRSKDFQAAAEVFAGLTRWGGGIHFATWPILLALTAGALTHAAPARLKSWSSTSFQKMPAFAQALVIVVSLSFFLSMSQTNAPFIYFQF